MYAKKKPLRNQIAALCMISYLQLHLKLQWVVKVTLEQF